MLQSEPARAAGGLKVNGLNCSRILTRDPSQPRRKDRIKPPEGLDREEAVEGTMTAGKRKIRPAQGGLRVAAAAQHCWKPVRGRPRPARSRRNCDRHLSHSGGTSGGDRARQPERAAIGRRATEPPPARLCNQCQNPAFGCASFPSSEQDRSTDLPGTQAAIPKWNALEAGKEQCARSLLLLRLRERLV